MSEIERQGTINDIENLVEDSYRELYEEMSGKYAEAMRRHEDLVEIIKMYELFVTDKEIIDRMNTLIEIRKNRIARVLKKYE